jgi:hypothetical protein
MMRTSGRHNHRSLTPRCPIGALCQSDRRFAQGWIRVPPILQSSDIATAQTPNAAAMNA